MPQSREHRCAESMKLAPGHWQFPNVHENLNPYPNPFYKNNVIKILSPPTSCLH